MPTSVPKFPAHVATLRHNNPFPGIYALQQRIGHPIRHRLGGNESLDAPLSALRSIDGETLREHVNLYGDPGCTLLRTVLAGTGGFDPSDICVDSGADAVLALCLRALCVPGDAAVCSAGTYPTFAYLARAAGCEVFESPYRHRRGHVRVDLDALLESVIRTEAKVVYLANPDNPTGSWHGSEDIDALCSNLPEYCTLLLDEAYLDFCSPLRHDSARVRQGCIRIRSLSKSYAMAGLRIGYALADQDTLAQLQKVRIHYAVGGLAQYLAQAVVSDQLEAAIFRASNARLRDELYLELADRGHVVLPSGTNFISVLMREGAVAAQVQQRLLGRGIAIHRPDHPAFANLLRITVCDDALREDLLSAFEGNVL
ncbi:pyridoxal phosphate-dependent aminotransferase [Burkholderia latens]|uniref:Aminotransferase n=1 Tax=Burkholderia latens TaxID=488446 RepID=A0A6H9SU73_9BURK|nr:aminotransferase class I/II-fold pyridoxal phosphate-dependent enzyme [Burkholderia latens]KAB0644180.1 aminotransferase class I/II-fold pyridoxal phosphate-dependent enzyme [Burkholderia latens]VWB44221.1 histidinol-phosphate aminotransferase [Burkholderia latens]